MTSPLRQSSAANLGDRAAKAQAQAFVGRVIEGRYKIVELLAMGGVGAVYLGEHLKMHKHVAIKVLHPDAQNLPDIAARFEREAVAGSHIQHPNVAVATDFGELEDDTHFLVLEYVRGTTLREVIKRGPLPVGRAVNIAKQIAAGLSATHAAGIVHRDVKPRNVMLIEGGRDVVKVIDFGLAKMNLKEVSSVAASHESMADQQITGIGAVFGTIAYLAPEAALGMDLVDARADLYALGLILYEMLAGRHPFDTSDPVGLFKHHARTPPPPLSERAPGAFVPPAVEAVAQRLLAKRREDRFANADEVIAALDAAWDSSSMSPTPSPVSMGGSMFPGPSILPPPPTSTPPPASVAVPLVPLVPQSATSTPRLISTPPPVSVTPSTPPSMPSATAPSAVRDLEIPAPPPPRSRWPYAAGLAGLGLAALAVWWPITTGPPKPAQPAQGSPAPSTVPAALSGVASPSGAPAASGAPRAAPAVAAMDPVVARATLRRAAAMRDRARGQEAFYALVEREPAAFHEAALAVSARDLATAVALAGGDEMDRLFDTLARKLGGDGLDILYEIVRVRGGSKAAARAEAALREPGVMDKGAPALRATWTLREAPCAEKAALLEKAKAEGDLRTLTVMQTSVMACLGPQSEPLKAAIMALRLRLR